MRDFVGIHNPWYSIIVVRLGSTCVEACMALVLIQGFEAEEQRSERDNRNRLLPIQLVDPLVVTKALDSEQLPQLRDHDLMACRLSFDSLLSSTGL